MASDNTQGSHVAVQQRQSRLPHWAIGALVGEAIWAIALLGVYVLDMFEIWFPHWFRESDVPDIVGSLCAVIAAPIACGGWMLIWGDNGPPYPWIGSWTFNIGFGVCFYGVLGAMAALLLARSGRRHFNISDMLGAMTLTAILWGLFTQFDRAGGFVSLGILFAWLVHAGLRQAM